MKKIILVISNRFQPNACGFIEEFEKLNGKIDGILCLEPEKNLISTLKKPLRFLKNFKPAALKEIAIRLICFVGDKQRLATLKNSWNNDGENSWDLLKNHFDIFSYAEKNNIPLQFSPFLSTEIVESYTRKNPVIFPMYGGGFLPEKIIRNPRAEFINAHMGSMPRYRGMNVIEWAVLENQPAVVAVMVMNEKIDGGDVIWNKDIVLQNEKSIPELRKTGYVFCYKAMAEGVFHYQKDESLRKKQGVGARFYYRMHGKIRRMVEMKLSGTAR